MLHVSSNMEPFACVDVLKLNDGMPPEYHMPRHLHSIVTKSCCYITTFIIYIASGQALCTITICL